MIEVQRLVCWIEGNRGKARFDGCIVMRVSGDVRPDRTGVPLLKFAHSFDLFGWIRILVHGLGFDRDFKGWMREMWKQELAKWFLGPLGRVWGPFFFFKPQVLTQGSQWWARIILLTDRWGD